MTKNYISLSEIKSTPVVRTKTGFNELDFIYGFSKFSNVTQWGMPKSKISLWAAESGTGKSRIAIDVAKNFTRIYPNSKVLYFQTESTLDDFAGWAGKDASSYKNFVCSGIDTIEDISLTICEVKPKLVIIDSINQVKEFNGSSASSSRVIDGTPDSGPDFATDPDGFLGELGLRWAANRVGCHIILLGQLNQNGTIKGGTSLPHLVDVALDLEKYDNDADGNFFTIKTGVKNRYGRKEDSIYGMWKHEEDGVISASDHSLRDKIWCDTHNIRCTTQHEHTQYLVKKILKERGYDTSKPVKSKDGSVIWNGVKLVGRGIGIGLVTTASVAVYLTTAIIGGIVLEKAVTKLFKD